MRVIRDRLMGAKPQAVARVVMDVLDRIQHRNVNDQILATACLFVLFIRRFNLNPAEILTAAERLMTDAEATRPEFTGATNYMKYEWQ